MIKRQLLTKATALVVAAVLMSVPAFTDASHVSSQAQDLPPVGASLPEAEDAAEDEAGTGAGDEEEDADGSASGSSGSASSGTGSNTGSSSASGAGNSGSTSPATGSHTGSSGASDAGNSGSGTSGSGASGTGDTSGTGATDASGGASGTSDTGSSGSVTSGTENTAGTDTSGNAATDNASDAVTDGSSEVASDSTEEATAETDAASSETETENAEEEAEPAEEEPAEEDPDAEKYSSETLSPEQEDALAQEEAEQESQARFDEYEAYNPALFSFTTDWRGWKQGSSAWYSMRNYGCRMTAYAKLLRATGIESPGHFSPDSFFRWCRSNGWLAGTIREIGTPGNCAIAYAEAKGRTLVREEAISLFKSADPEARKQEIIDKINEGYYVILCSSAHFVYVDEVRTRLTQELWVDDSINGDNVYKVDRYVFQGSLADYENADPRKNWHYRYFSVEDADEAPEPLHVTDVHVHSVNGREGYYTLDAVVSADASQIDRVMFPTWTAKDDKDDLDPEWEYGTSSEGYLVPALSDEKESVYRFYVRLADHNDETGKYFTYVYAYGRDGRRSAPGTITVPLRR